MVAWPKVPFQSDGGGLLALYRAAKSQAAHAHVRMRTMERGSVLGEVVMFAVPKQKCARPAGKGAGHQEYRGSAWHR